MASSFTKLITTYINAKDSNKPHLMNRVFSKDATLNMIVNVQFVPAGLSREGRRISRGFFQMAKSGGLLVNYGGFCHVSPA